MSVTSHRLYLRWCYALFVIGIGLYATALFFIGNPNGETLSDIGNGVMLTTAVLLLLRIECAVA